jgi:4-carboxymuconolactone decarboxylase
MAENKYDVGFNKFKNIYGELCIRVLQNVNETSPDMMKYIVEFVFGGIYSRKGLDIKSRETVFISSLLTLGNAIPQLKSHIHGALNIGCTRGEILEIVIQILLYSGFSNALNGLQIVKEVFEERDKNGINN